MLTVLSGFNFKDRLRRFEANGKAISSTDGSNVIFLPLVFPLLSAAQLEELATLFFDL